MYLPFAWKRNINYDNKVSKLLTDKDAKDELKELSLFKEIDKLEEAWSMSVIKDKETRKEDKQTIKKLQREVAQSLRSRK